MAIGEKEQGKGTPPGAVGDEAVGISYRLPSHGLIENMVCEASMERRQGAGWQTRRGQPAHRLQGRAWLVWGTARRRAWLEYGSRELEL